MGLLTQAMARGSNELDPLLMGLGDPTEPGLLSQAISWPLKIGSHLLSPLMVPGDLTRSLIGLMQGQELSDRGVYGIPTVSGERMLEGFGLDMGPNVRGKAEWRDVPGFAAEVLFDPQNLIGLGALTKLGKGAKQAATLLQKVKVLEDAGGILPAGLAKLKGEATEIMQRAGGKMGSLEEMEALARSERQFAAWRPPFAQARKILPENLNRMLVEGTRAAGRGVGGLKGLPGLRKITEALEGRGDVFREGMRVWGRAESKILKDAARIEENLARIQGREVAFHINKLMKDQNPETIETSLAELRRITDAGVESELLTNEKVLRLTRLIERTTDPEKLATHQATLNREKSRIARLGAQIPKSGFGARRADHQIFNSLAESLGLEDKIDQYVAKAANRLNEAAGRMALDATEAEWPTIQKQILGAKQRLADRIAPLLMRKKVSKSLVDYMAHAHPDMLAEVERLHRVVGKRLIREQATGGSVWELADPYVAYMHRATTQGGMRAMREMEKLGMRDSVAARFFRTLTHEPGHYKERVRELDGMGVSVVNDFIDADLRRSFTIAAQRQNITDPALVKKFVDRKMRDTLGGETFFIEDPAEIALRRITASGMATENQLFVRGSILMTSIPKELAGKSDITVAKAVKRYRIGDVGGQVGLANDDALRSKQLDMRGLSEKEITKALKGTRLENHYVPSEIVAEMDKVTKLFNDSELMREALGFINTWNSAMRFHVTASALPVPWGGSLGAVGRGISGGMLGAAAGGAIGGVPGAAVGAGIGATAGAIAGVVPLFPGFSLRNENTNMFMAWLVHGAKPSDIKYWIRAGLDARGANRALQLGSAASDADRAALKRTRNAEAWGSQYGTFVQETAQTLGPAGARRTGKFERLRDWMWRPQSTELGQRGMAVNQAVENNAKLGLHYMLKARHGSDLLASEGVSKALFDYGAISPWEKKYARKLAFFYTFQRKALPLMVESILTQPRKMRAVAMAGGMRPGSAQDEMFTEYQQQRMPMAAPGFFDKFRAKDGSRMFFDFDYPINLLTMFDPEGRHGLSAWKRSLSKLGALFAPPLRMPAELMAGQSLQSGRDQSFMQTIGGALPTARMMAALKRHGLTEKRRYPSRGNVELLRELGISPMFVDPEDAKSRKRLEAINLAIEREVTAGRARQYQVPFPTTEEPRERAIIKLLARERSSIQQRRRQSLAR